MEVKINVLEVASDLAHNSMLDEARTNMSITDDNEVYENSNADTLVYKEEFQDIFNRWYDYYFEMITNKMDTTYFEITSISREDLEHAGYDTSDVDDDTMRKLASKMGDDYCEQLFWVQLPIIADYLGIPLKQKENEED